MTPGAPRLLASPITTSNTGAPGCELAVAHVTIAVPSARMTGSGCPSSPLGVAARATAALHGPAPRAPAQKTWKPEGDEPGVALARERAVAPDGGDDASLQGGQTGRGARRGPDGAEPAYGVPDAGGRGGNLRQALGEVLPEGCPHEDGLATVAHDGLQVADLALAGGERDGRTDLAERRHRRLVQRAARVAPGDDSGSVGTDGGGRGNGILVRRRRGDRRREAERRGAGDRNAQREDEAGTEGGAGDEVAGVVHTGCNAQSVAKVAQTDACT
jgi:hypothetical protein